MESDKIKAIVAKVKALSRGEEDAGSVMNAMVKDMGRSPTFAVAIIQRLNDEGIDLMTEDGEEAEAFKAKFRPQMEKLGERELSQSQRILSRLF